MNIAILRRKFPEYGDVADADLMEMFHNMFSEIMDTTPEKEAEVVIAPGVESAVSEVAALVEKANSLLATISKTLNKPEKPEKEEKDMTPHFMALGVQLQNIEAAVKALLKEELTPEVETPPKVLKEFKIKYHDMGGIDKVIPVYEA